MFDTFLRQERAMTRICLYWLIVCTVTAISVFVQTLPFLIISFLVIPFVAAWTLSKGRLLTAAVCVSLTEVVLGGQGRWAVGGGAASVRYFVVGLLVILGLIQFAIRPQLSRAKAVRRNIVIAVFCGMLLPFLLVSYSLLRFGTEVGVAIDDCKFLPCLLIIIPLTLCVQEDAILIAGVFVACLITLAGLHVAWLFSKDLLHLYLLWFAGNLSYLPNGFPRLSLSVTSLLPCGVAFGLLFLQRCRTFLGKLLAVVLVGLSAAGLAIGLSRALIITTVALVGLHLAMRSRGRTRQLIIWVPLVLIPVGFYCYTTMREWAPEGVERFEKAFDFSSQSRANAERAQQAGAMLAQWETSPIMGTGVGVALQSGYSRYSNGLLFELQYHALLYKTGLVGLISLISLILFCVKPVFGARKRILGEGQDPKAVVWLALANGVLAIAVCGAVNPYLTGAYFSLLVALQLAYDAALPTLADDSCKRTRFEPYQRSGGHSSACRRAS